MADPVTAWHFKDALTALLGLILGMFAWFQRRMVARADQHEQRLDRLEKTCAEKIHRDEFRQQVHELYAKIDDTNQELRSEIAQTRREITDRLDTLITNSVRRRETG